ncbi:MAG: BTAD domain-containing putative transcriptional regulator [Gemmatimonadota bacterium]
MTLLPSSASLTTLGRPAVAGVTDARAAALLARPKRLALVAYLALEGPKSREAVASLFWPGSRRERGRGALRNAVHFLRRHLGPTALRGQSDMLLLDAGSVRCDVVTFRTRIAERRFEDAAELYRGTFLHGLRIVGAPELVSWIEEWRTELAREASAAHWALADRGEALENWISAADSARRAVALSGNEETGVRRLMRLLDRAGDRVAALREYETFAGRWEREMDLTPSPATRRLADSLRKGAGGAGRARALHAPGPRRVSRYGRVAVLPLTLPLSNPTHLYLAAGLAQELVESLSRLRTVQVIGRVSAGRYGDGDPGVVRRAARELDVDAVVDGSLTASEGRLAVVIRLLDSATETTVWADVHECAISGTLELRSRLVESLLDALDADLPRGEREEISRGPTSDASAFDAYLRGRWCMTHRSQAALEKAVGHFEKALSIDGQFALALAGIAQANLLLYPAAGRRGHEIKVRAQEYARAALAVDPELGEVRAVLGMVKGHFEHDFEGGVNELRRATELSPGHATAHHWYGAFLTFLCGRFEEGERSLELASQLDPFSPIVRNDIGLAALRRGDVGEAIEKLRGAVRLEPSFWRSHFDLGIACFVAGDREAGARHLQRAWALGAFGAKDLEKAGPASERGWREVLERKLAELATTSLHRGTRGFEAALVCMLLGRHQEAIDWLTLVDEEGSVALIGQYYPPFSPLEGNPAFDDLLRAVGLRAPRG